MQIICTSLRLDNAILKKRNLSFCPCLALPSAKFKAILKEALNITEGSGRQTVKDKKRFYAIAFGSCRETQLLVKIIEIQDLIERYDRLGGLIYGLIRKSEYR